tara:strand:+ start:90 stop:680 length:591 start_codon:yes stop_codon:yes gene_type:complete
MTVIINGSGTITGISVGGLPDGIVDTDMLAANAVTAAKRGAGAILQVKQTLKTDVFTTTSYPYTDVTGLSVSITPTSSSNKILILIQVTGDGTQSEARAGFRCFRDGNTAIGSGTASGNRVTGFGNIYHPSDNHQIGSLVGSILDTPGDTSSHTYQIQASNLNNASTIYVNRSQGDDNQYYGMRSSSSITAMEVAA